MVCEITLIFVKEQEWNQVKFFLFKNNRNDLYHFKKICGLFIFVCCMLLLAILLHSVACSIQIIYMIVYMTDETSYYVPVE